MNDTTTHARTGSAPKHERPFKDDADIERLPCPKVGRRDYHDRATPGLKVRVSQAGRSFIVRKRAPRLTPAEPGRDWKVVVGQFPTMTLHDAREKARTLIGRIERGENPCDTPAETMTLGEAYRWMLSQRSLKPATRRDYEYRWDLHLAAYAKEGMAGISVDWVKDRMNAAQEGAHKGGSGVHTANRLRSLLGSIFTEWCERQGLNPAVASPVRRVNKVQHANGESERKRTQMLTVDQARAYADALEEYAHREGNPILCDQRRSMADFLMLNMRVGLRRSNGIGLKWDWVDFESETITVPAAETKTKKELVVNIPPPVLAMLARRRAVSESPFVFPGRRDPDKPMNSPGRAHRAVLVLAGLPADACTIHDMRRTLGSAMIAAGADVSEVREQLGHSNIATTSIYLNLKPNGTGRRSLDRASALFDGEGE